MVMTLKANFSQHCIVRPSHCAVFSAPALYSEVLLPSSDAECEVLPWTESAALWKRETCMFFPRIPRAVGMLFIFSYKTTLLYWKKRKKLITSVFTDYLKIACFTDIFILKDKKLVATKTTTTTWIYRTPHGTIRLAVKCVYFHNVPFCAFLCYCEHLVTSAAMKHWNVKVAFSSFRLLLLLSRKIKS